MLKLTDEQMKACYANGYFRRYTFEFDSFTLDAEVIHTESVIIKEAICEDTELKLGGCIASSCEFEVSETVTDNINLSGLRFKAYLHLYRASEDESSGNYDNPDKAIGEEIGAIPMGVYNVRSVEMIDDADYKKVTAYDDLYDWDVDVSEWYNDIFPSDIISVIYTLDGEVIDATNGIPENAIQKTVTTTGKMSIKDLRESLLAYLMGLGGEIDVDAYQVSISANYINDELEVTKTLEISGEVKALDLLRYLCEIAGGFGRINRYGVFEIVSLGTTGGLYPENNLYPEDSKEENENLYPEDSFVYLGGDTEDEETPDFISTHYEEYNVQPISCVTFSMSVTTTSTDDSGSMIEENGIIGISYPENSTENPYVSDNPFLLSLELEVLQNVAKKIYEKISGIIYRPNNTTLQGVPYYEVGDYYNVTKKISFESFVLSRTITGIQGLRDEFSANGLEIRENNVSPAAESYMVMAKYMNISKNSDGIYIEVADMQVNQKTNLEITAQGITSKVASSQYTWDDNKYQIDEYGFGEPELNYKIKYEWDTSKYESEKYIHHTYSIPNINQLAEYQMVTWLFCKEDTGMLYQPRRTGVQRNGVWLSEARRWRGIAKLKKNTIYEYDYNTYDVGKTYLDENTGRLYKLTGWNLSSDNPGFRWEHIDTLTKVTVQLETIIEQTAEEIRLEASKTYATDSYVRSEFKAAYNMIAAEVEERKGDSERLSSNITQTSAQIELAVSKNSDTWSTSVTISARGYGIDYSNGYYYKDYASDRLISSGYYLDEQYGRIYRIVSGQYTNIDGIIRLRMLYYGQATRTTENLSSRISQTAHSVELETTDGEKSAGITIRIRDENGNVIGGDSDNITLTGVVGFSDLEGNGTTKINGANITTGTIDADRINLNTVASKTKDPIAFPSTGGVVIGNELSGTYVNNDKISCALIEKNRMGGDGTTLHITNDYGEINFSSADGCTFENATRFEGDICARRIRGIDSGAFDIVSNGLFIYPSGTMYINNLSHGTTSDRFVRINANGYLCYTDGASSSSRRYKYDIKPVENKELDPYKILEIPIKQFKFNNMSEAPITEQNKDVIGMVAEDVAEIYPVAAIYRNGMVENWNERYLIPPMLSLIQEMYQEINVLKNEIIRLGGNIT